MLVQIALYPPFTYELQILWYHVTLKNDTFNQEKWYLQPLILKSYTCDPKITYHENLNHENYYHENLKIYISGFYIMKWATMKLYLCKWCYSLFWLVGYTFCDNMSPWNNTIATMKMGTYNHEKWHLWYIKLIHITIKISKLAHVILKKNTMKF
jgi:hypothetical protein